MRTLLAIIVFFGLYAAADYLGGHMPAWVGYSFLIGAIIGLIWAIAKIGRSL